MFIRAPRTRSVGADVEVIDTLAGEPILIRQGGLKAATFHPELTDGVSVHAAVFPKAQAR